MGSSRLLDDLSYLESVRAPEVAGDIRVIYRQLDIVNETLSQSTAERSASRQRRQERHALRIIEQRTARALRKLARGEQAA